MMSLIVLRFPELLEAQHRIAAHLAEHRDASRATQYLVLEGQLDATLRGM